MSGKEPFKFMTISELLGVDGTQLVGRMVRTIGILESHDESRNLIMIRDKWTCLELPVTSTMIEPFSFKKGEAFQFSGEVCNAEGSDGAVVLKAILSRCVAGLDLHVYLQARRVRQKDIEEDANASWSSEDLSNP